MTKRAQGAVVAEFISAWGERAMANDKPQIQRGHSPLKVRGARGVMRARLMEVTPYIPLTLRGRFGRRCGFGIPAFGFYLSFGF
jgi:hypothetical protein